MVTRHSGRQSVTTTIHVRDWGRLWVEINDTNISAAGINVLTRNRVIHDGARIITIDTASGRATGVTNPLYDQIVAAMRGRSGVEFGRETMTQMGGRATGERGSFAIATTSLTMPTAPAAAWKMPSGGTRMASVI